MKKKYAIMCLIALSTALLSAGCQEEKENNNGHVELKIVSIGNTTKEYYDIKNAEINALQLLKNKHNVTLNLGNNAVRCIDNICAGSGYWWPMYVNGKISTLGINNYNIKKGDMIEFRFARK